MALETELRFFESIKEDLLKKASGKYALIVGKELIGTFDHRAEAYERGVHRFGNVPMLIHRIVEGSNGPEVIPALTLGLLHAVF